MTKKYLGENYKYLKQMYKQYSSYGNNKYYCLNFINFTDIMDDINIVDETFKMNACDITYISTYSGKANDRYKINPDKCLIRFEWMEALLRLAKDKYIR